MKIPAFIKQLAKLCDPESRCYALGGVQISSDGKTAQMSATDGRILASVHYADAGGKAFTTIAPAKDVSNGPAAAYKAGVTFDGKHLRSGGEATEVAAIDGRFPRVEDVFSRATEKGYVAVMLDAHLLRKLCDLSHAMNDGDRRGITLFVKDSESCVFASTTGTDGQVARMAIMPRASDTSPPAPFPASPGAAPAAEKAAAESVGRRGRGVRKPAIPPEMMTAKQVAAAISEPDEIGCDWSVSLSPI